MVMPSEPARLERDLVALAGRAPDSHSLRTEAMARVRRAVPVDAYCFSTVDPETLVMSTNATDGVDRRRAPDLFALEYGTAPDAARHAELARARVPVRVLSRATAGDPTRSPRFQQLLRPMGVEHELRAAVRVDGRTWGFLHLFRGADRRDFCADEVALVERIVATLARGLRDIALRSAFSAVPASAAPALLVLDRANRLVESTPGAVERLAALRDADTPAGAVPDVLVTLAIWARVVAAAGGTQAARARVTDLGGGWHELHASRTDGDRVAIIAQHADGARMLPLVLESFGLTRGEREVVELTLEGRSTKEMAELLVLSTYTVQDRLKGVFDKVGVRSRRDLVARLTGGR